MTRIATAKPILLVARGEARLTRERQNPTIGRKERLNCSAEGEAIISPKHRAGEMRYPGVLQGRKEQRAVMMESADFLRAGVAG